MRMRRNLIWSIALVALMALSASSAQAAFPPGKNGVIAYQRFDEGSAFELFRMNANGTGQANLTNSTLTELNAAYSPLGTRIVFARSEGSNADLFGMNPDGSGLASLTLTPLPLKERAPTWAPDGSRIVFNNDTVADDPRDLFAVDPDGSGLTNLTNTTGLVEANADFSPDGRRLVYQRCLADACNIHLSNANGTGARPLTPGPDDSDPAFSPDGRTIVFERGGEVFLMNADGSVPTNLTNTPGDTEASPVFSPDGRGVLFASTPPTGVADLVTIPVGGSARTNLTNTPLSREERPAWQSLQSCAGRPVTIVGDSGPDKVKGTNGPDVIATFGGKDKIAGRGGSDRICAGAGKDRISGGGGKKDLCRGGAGKDRGGKGCERGKL
jgi:Tol biopolymer transport system component